MKTEQHSIAGDWRYIKRPNAEKSTIPFAIEKPFKGYVEPIADICAFPPNNEGELSHMEANAEFIVKACNSYSDLLKVVEALKDILLWSKAKDGKFSYVSNNPNKREELQALIENASK